MKKTVLGAMVLCLVTGTALASYEKDAAKFLKKNPSLSAEIVEGLKTCQLVKGMTEEQARLVAKELTGPALDLKIMLDYHLRKPPAKVDRTATTNDRGQSVVVLSFYVEDRGVLRQKENIRTTSRVRPLAILDMFFTNDALTKWESEGLWGKSDGGREAEMKARVEKELAKLEAKK
jgi:hypothetical protein